MYRMLRTKLKQFSQIYSVNDNEPVQSSTTSVDERIESDGDVRVALGHERQKKYHHTIKVSGECV